MIRLRARTLHRYGGGHVRSVASAVIRDPAVEAARDGRRQPPATKSVSQAHKERIMATLIDNPAGVTTEELSAVLGLGPARTYTLIRELTAEGLVDKLGATGNACWIAQV